MYQTYPNNGNSDSLGTPLTSYLDVTEQLLAGMQSETKEFISIDMRSFAIVRAALITILRSIVGIETVATFVERLVLQFHDSYGTDRSKECTTLLLIITYLFNFQTVGSILLYDIVKRLIQAFEELDIELMMLIFKSKFSPIILALTDPHRFGIFLEIR